MQPNQPDTKLLALSLLGLGLFLALFIGEQALSRQRTLTEGEQRLLQLNQTLAEHTSRAFESVDILLREISNDLGHRPRSWADEPSEALWDYLARRHSRSMAQLRTLVLLDEQGFQRAYSEGHPAPRRDFSDRPYFQSLARGKTSEHFGPYLSRNADTYSYAFSRRLETPQGRFQGAIAAAVEPRYFQDFCWPLRLGDQYDAYLVNAQNEVIASCRPVSLGRESPVLGKPLEALSAANSPESPLPTAGLVRHGQALMAITPIAPFPDLRIVSNLPADALLADWRDRLTELVLIAAFITVIVLTGTFLARRQLRTLNELALELHDSRELLASRVAAATEEIAVQRDAAERANTAKSRFLAAASHDLRQPLHALSLFAADLRRLSEQGDTVAVQALTQRIAISASVLGDLLDSLLDLSRLDVGGIHPQPYPHALQPTFDRLLTAYGRNAADAGLRLRFRPTRLGVETDANMLERIIANLLSNAIRYTPRGGTVLVAARPRGDQVIIEVRDNGVGIPKEHQANIFAEFYQVGNAAREYNKGLGLGLSIVERLARALKIEVGLRSDAHQGTCFRLKVGRADAPADAAALPKQPVVRPRVCLLGESTAFPEIAEHLQHWDYQPEMLSTVDDLSDPENVLAVLIDLTTGTGDIADTFGDLPVIRLEPVDAPRAERPEGTLHLSQPVRPAKLRALLAQLQKRSSKSMA